MEYKQTLIDLFTKMSNNGLEGAIPTLIVECLRDANFKHNQNNKIIKSVRNLCDTELKQEYSTEVADIMINHFDEKKGCWCVDVWHTDDEDEEGEVVAEIYEEDGEIVYRNEWAKHNSQIQSEISTFLGWLSSNKDEE